MFEGKRGFGKIRSVGSNEKLASEYSADSTDLLKNVENYDFENILNSYCFLN